MAYYGNILIAYRAEEEQLREMEKVLQDLGTRYEQAGPSFFIETASMSNTGKVISKLKELNIEFLFFHNHISDGSLIACTGLPADTVEKINDILFK